MYGWNTSVSFWDFAYFQGRTVSFRECIPEAPFGTKKCLPLFLPPTKQADPPSTCKQHLQLQKHLMRHLHTLPENRPSQNKSSFPTSHFQVLLLIEEILHQVIW